MASDEPGPGQQYALQVRKHIATLRRARPEIVIEIRWCPAHKGVAGNKKADEWAKIAAEDPDTRGVEWLRYSCGGRTEVRAMPLPHSLANLKREMSEKKWAEARQWAGGRTSKKKSKLPKSQRPDGTVAGSTKRIPTVLPDQDGALPDGAVSQLNEKSGDPAMQVVPLPSPDSGAPLQGVPGVEGPAEDPVGEGAEGDAEEEEPVEPGGRAVWTGGTGLPHHHRRGKAGASRGG